MAGESFCIADFGTELLEAIILEVASRYLERGSFAATGFGKLIEKENEDGSKRNEVSEPPGAAFAHGEQPEDGDDDDALVSGQCG